MAACLCRAGESEHHSQAAALAPMAGGVVTQTGNGATLIYDNPPMWSVQRFFASDYLNCRGILAWRQKWRSIRPIPGR